MLYDIALVLVGIAVPGAVALPRLLDNRPISFPIVYVAFGAVVFALPLGLPATDPIEFGTVTACYSAAPPRRCFGTRRSPY